MRQPSAKNTNNNFRPPLSGGGSRFGGRKKKAFDPSKQAVFIQSLRKAGEEFNEEGAFVRTRFTNDEGFVIGTFLVDGTKEEIVIKGTFPNFGLGLRYKVTGEVVIDPTWGIQVKSKQAVPLAITGKSETLAFLSSGAIKGIGPSIAMKIYDKFGGETIEVLEKHPERLLEVPGIGKAKIDKIRDSAKAVLADREAIAFFSSHGISLKTTERLIKEYGTGNKAVKTVQSNPYLLCRVKGFAFTRADEMARRIGIAENDPNRLEAAVVAMLRYAASSSGSTIIPGQTLISSTIEKIGYQGSPEDIERAAERLVKAKRIIKTDKGVQLLYLWKDEKIIAQAAHNAVATRNIAAPTDVKQAITAQAQANSVAISLTDQQEAAVRNAFSHPLSILTGGAGVGKTSVCEMVVKVALSLDIPLCLVSPTGRAAKRLSAVCGQKAYTVHRALSIAMSKANDDDYFAEDESCLRASKGEAGEVFDSARLVIADEASMMDTEMAAIVMKASAGKNLVLVGDPNQLPSVGPGRVLGDLIEFFDVPCVQLTKVFRQAQDSPVVKAATQVEKGKSPCYEEGVVFYEASNQEVPGVIIEKILPELAAEGVSLDDVMVMAPMKKTPFAGVDELNVALRPVMNPRYRSCCDPKDEWKLQAGDIVSQKKNNYDVNVFNGDVGRVFAIKAGGDVEVDFADSDDFTVYEPNEISENLMLAYASTVHRQQGSQAHTAIVVATDSHFVMLSRNLLYTAITRAEKKIYLVGSKKAFATAARNAKEQKRTSGLQNVVKNGSFDGEHGETLFDC